MNISKAKKFSKVVLIIFGASAVVGGVLSLIGWPIFREDEQNQFALNLVGFGYLGGILAAASLFVWIASLVAGAALKKGRNWTSFFIFSLFVPLIMWIIVATISTDQATSTLGTKKCPKCAELVKFEATVCKHCTSQI